MRELLWCRPSVQFARPEPFDSPLVLSLSKDERLAQDAPVEGRAQGSWFDKLTTSGWCRQSGKDVAPNLLGQFVPERLQLLA
jgi:hypothetical protein